MGILDRITGASVPDSTVVDMAEYAGRSAAPASYNVTRPLVAAAKRVNLKSSAEILEMQDRPFAAWQSQAWEYYDVIGEVKYAFGLLASVMSRLRLYPAVVVDPDAPPTSVSQLFRREVNQTDEEKQTDEDNQLTPPDDLSEEIAQYMTEMVAALGSGYGGITGLLRSFTLNTSVGGESYLVNLDGRWSIRSSQEVSVRPVDGKLIIKEARTGRNVVQEKEYPANTFVGRIWRQHPRFSREPDSSMLALLEPCDELLTLQKMIRGIARSRMNAGMLFMPDGLSVAGQSVAETVEEAEAEDQQFLDELFTTMTAPIQDESASSSVVPLVVQGAEDLGEKIKHILFERKSDQFLVERADRALERIMQGIDVPKDLVTGLANVRYSNAIQINEGLYKSHIEPLAVMLCDALTSMYLRQAIKAKFSDVSTETLNKIVIWYDPTEVVIRPDPAEAATVGYENFLISGDAWRRANGFSDTDAPTQSELALRMVLTKLNNLPPETAAMILEQALPSLFEGVEETKTSTVPTDKAAPEPRYGADDAVMTDTFDADTEMTT